MEQFSFSEQDILERVDEYTLYCSYLGFEPLIGAKYLSPIRSGMDAKADSDPSFGIFERKYGKGANELMWKDQGKGVHGDVFDLVKLICKLGTRREAMIQVLVDAGLVDGVKIKPIPDTTEKKFMGCSEITIQPKDWDTKALNYWDRINVSRSILDMYSTKTFKPYWLFKEQAYPRFAKGLGFAYPIYDKYQLYFPFEEKKRKFRSDYTNVCVPGFLQLQYNSPLLIITKSHKDIMCLRSFGYEAISPRGENCLLPQECIANVKRKYQRILILFDNDGKTKADEYEFDKIWIPKILPGDKDISDFTINHGKQQAAELLKTLTNS